MSIICCKKERKKRELTTLIYIVLKGFGKEKFEKFVNNMDMDDDTTEINLDEFLMKAYSVTERLLLVRYAI